MAFWKSTLKPLWRRTFNARENSYVIPWPAQSTQTIPLNHPHYELVNGETRCKDCRAKVEPGVEYNDHPTYCPANDLAAAWES